MSLWVVDTSPLIFLSKLQHLDLLRASADEIFAPPSVLSEVRQQADSASQEIEEASTRWLKIEPLENREVVEILSAALDLGEAEAIALAQHLKADRIVMDDLDGRRFARRLGLPVVGTLGLVLAARLRGEIPSLRHEVDRLLEAGFRVAPALLEDALRAAGELEGVGT
jgi:predicted nucleic acid-binding protein